MHIIYLLTNKSKQVGKRFYIGSKTDCKVIEIKGVHTIIRTSNGKPYYSSSTCPEMRQDLLNGDIFEATILEQISHKNKSNIIETEDKWIRKYDAVNSTEFYNLAYPLKYFCNNKDKFQQTANKYGQSVIDLAKDNSTLSKKDGSAKSLGFKNFGELCFEIWNEYKVTNNWSAIAKKYGKHKGFCRVYVEQYDMAKAEQDLKLNLQKELRSLIDENCSLRKACEVLNIEYPAGRVLLGEYLENKSFTVSRNLGLSKEELEISITKRILDGEGFREVSNSTGLIYESVKRYFFRCIRKRLKSSDL